MGLTFSVVLVLGAAIPLLSLRIRGCVSFVLWMVLGLAAAWFVLQFASGGLRI